MKTKLKTTRVLIIDSMLIVLLAVVFISTNIYLIKHVNSNLKTIDKNLEEKLNIVMRMTNIARERSALMLSMYNETDAWKIDEEFQRFHRLVLDFIQLRKELEKKGLSVQEAETLKSALQIIHITEPLQNGIVERIQSGDLDTVADDISQKDIPLEIELLGVFELLSKQIIQTSFESRTDIQNQFYKTLGTIALLSVLIVLGLIIIMIRSLKKIQKIEMGLLIETENLNWDATHDPLTNIYNRRWLKYKIDLLFDNKSDTSNLHSLIYMDLDGFKIINDNYGHVAGDQYLQALCRKVEFCIRQNDTFARVGGDEFAILLANCELDKSKMIAEHILKTVKDFVCDFEGHQLSAGCSIGVYEFSQAEQSFDKIIRQADSLCYNSKKEGKNRISVNKETKFGSSTIVSSEPL